jgi:phenylpropionate dioxygenase-like ring-hydroxylating dioxygenase large terminal subunit
MFIPVGSRPEARLRPESSKISESDWGTLADFWHPVAFAHALTDKPLPVKLLDLDLVLFRGSNHSLGAAVDVCPHRQVRLSGGRVIDGLIACPFHGLRFDTSGRCRLIPALGPTARLPASYQVRTFPAQERYGLIWVCLGTADKHEIPVFPDIANAPASSLGFAPALLWRVSAPRQIENFFDLGHLPLVHATTLGGDVDGRVAPGQVRQTKDAVILEADYIERPFGGEPRPCTFIYRIVLPFAIDFTVRDNSPYTMHGYNVASPTSAYESSVFQILKILPEDAAGASAKLQQSAVDFFGLINQEDINVLAGLTLGDLPLEQHHEIHLPVDNICGAYRARLRELGLGRAASGTRSGRTTQPRASEKLAKTTRSPRKAPSGASSRARP